MGRRELEKDIQLTNFERILASLSAGAVAGGLAKTTVAPFDRTKIHFQISSTKQYSTRKAIRFLVDCYRKEGLRSLWRGNSATMARIIPYAAIQFTAHEQWKRLLGVDAVTAHSSSSKKRFLAGSLAGVTSQALTYPLDLARARMAVTGKECYNSLIEVFSKTWHDEGMRGFYKGFVPTVLGVIPYAGTSFYTYGMLKLWYTDKFANPHPLLNMVCGACAGMLGQCTSYPLDIVRRRMQTATITGGEYNSTIQSIRKIYREEGIKRGFFKGLSMNWIKGPIAVGISFASFDYVHLLTKSALSKTHHLS
ncbi:mitochondrial coenzyme A transporter SLC25A42 isoform X2 [Nilaparvata lugens]|uniref:mitochondrial coenzyme A transporter SLC25A42 isoform X2 n=1 Tax=Nilaparvata lugens TaxID=108931 RepID=UPI000B99395C|nr:mitochondrial coenzyme A transporter SLC25A42 isoform X2 [Nilaparvata lugens]XP_039281768.1 mitochondrial coenzyme A transporter SLC25A42 isoform X2 [Nilaparvata lugens]XP_039281769.1 mitochondrial coenzyme A transporter SLC25A42 isoform X2 [Nilaparvata lugens]